MIGYLRSALWGILVGNVIGFVLFVAGMMFRNRAMRRVEAGV